MVTIPNQRPIYIILDALDECPNSYGIPSPREHVLNLARELMDLHLPHLHICITSRPEFDIRATLGPLALHTVSLHDESGQNEDIVDYINSVVYSDSETMMKRWREEEKKMVVDALSEKADGMFRWVFCQLEALRQCLPQSVRRTLNELPDSLDETYKRVLMEIKRTNQVHTYRLLQCLMVAVRPLSVAELAELLALDFDVANGGIPKLNSDWRWEDHEQAVLSTCSSLISVIPSHESPIVQFSHFSVKEFLMSDRLATSTGDTSRYHISLNDAHTVLAQASLGVLLRYPDVNLNDGADDVPLVRYAAEHWVTHARVEDVASRVHDGMERLFDPDEPYFEAWVHLYDADLYNSGRSVWSQEPGARPLYYAALCGFLELVEHLTLKYPQSASARGGYWGTALHSTSFAGHLQIVRSLLRYGVGVDVRGHANGTPLRFASQSGHRDVVQCLLDHGADVNSQDDEQITPLNWAAYGGHVDVVRVLLKHNADVDSRDYADNTPLNWAAFGGHVDIARVLLEHNADANSKDEDGRTPLHNACAYNQKGDYPQLVRLLLEHGANANARDAKHMTPLHLMSSCPSDLDVARILLEHGADVDAKNRKGMTPLQVALVYEQGKMARLLSEFRSGRTQT